MIIENTKDSIVELYTYMQVPSDKISKMLHISSKTVSYILKENGIDIRCSKASRRCGYEKRGRKYVFNEHFFDIIDTEEKAYILGFFMADGTNIENIRTVQMFLQSEDRYILEKINEILESNRPIRHINPPKKFPNRKHQDAITLRSLHFSNRLKELGMCSMKSYLLKFPTYIPEELMYHFIRGYFGGGGSIYHSKDFNRYGFNFVGTEDFIENLRDVLSKNCGLGFVKIHTRFPERNNTTRYITYSGRLQAIKFGNWLYKDATIYLTRKLDKFPPEVKILTGLTNQ